MPEGATPKDGPSAGVSMTTAVISLALNQPVVPDLAMTGEVSLTGKVLPVGGIKEKTIAARRSACKTLIFPEGNRRDVDELPDYLKEDITFEYAKTYDDVYRVAFGAHAGGELAGRDDNPGAGRGRRSGEEEEDFSRVVAEEESGGEKSRMNTEGAESRGPSEGEQPLFDATQSAGSPPSTGKGTGSSPESGTEQEPVKTTGAPTGVPQTPSAAEAEQKDGVKMSSRLGQFWPRFL